MLRSKRIVSFIAGISAPLLWVGQSTAADADKSFKGQTVTYIVATSAGGGYDFYGRLVSEFMERNLPGSTFVVKNAPGAGHVIGANQIYAAKPDGLTIGSFNTGVLYGQIVGLKGIQFDLKKMSWIGKAASEQRVILISATSPIKSFGDLKRASNVIFSTSGVGSAAYVEMRVLVELFNLPVKLVTGYTGTDDKMAMRRGEVTGTMASRSSNQDFVDNGYGRFIAQVGGTQKDVPQLATYADTPEAKALIALFQSQAEISRLTAGPPDIPADRLRALRTAYTKAVNDKEFRAKAAKGGREVDPASGEQVEELVKAALDLPPRIVAMLKEAMEAKAPTLTASGKVLEVLKGGRTIVIESKDGKLTFEPSGSRTKVTIAGKDAKRGQIKPGQACKFSYPEGSSEPTAVAC